jgi:hypothetical protein
MSEQYPISTYKKLIHDMVDELTEERFIKQIYSIIYIQLRRRKQQ